MITAMILSYMVALAAGVITVANLAMHCPFSASIALTVSAIALLINATIGMTRTFHD